MTETRKIAAVLAADGVGFSQMASADEDHTLAQLRTMRSELIDPTEASQNRREPAIRGWATANQGNANSRLVALYWPGGSSRIIAYQRSRSRSQNPSEVKHGLQTRLKEGGLPLQLRRRWKLSRTARQEGRTTRNIPRARSGRTGRSREVLAFGRPGL